MNGANQQLEGKITGAKDFNGVLIADAILKAGGETAQGGVISYLYPRPGQTEPVRKTVFARKFAPWNATISYGLYVDDIDADVRALTLELAAMGIGLMLLMAALSWLIAPATCSARSTARRTANETGNAAAMVLAAAQQPVQAGRAALRRSRDIPRRRARSVGSLTSPACGRGRAPCPWSPSNLVGQEGLALAATAAPGCSRSRADGSSRSNRRSTATGIPRTASSACPC